MSGDESGGGTCGGEASGKESGEESGEESGGGDEGSGDRGVCQGSGRGDVPHRDCVTGWAFCQANGGGSGEACWNGGGGRHFPCHPSS